MVEVYIYDYVCMLCGKGKVSGSLYEVIFIELGIQVFELLCEWNDLDMSKVDDVVFGCVFFVGEQGGDIICIVVLNVDYVELIVGVQINWFCVSGLEVMNMVVVKVMSGEVDMIIGGGIESMSCVLMGLDGGLWVSNFEVVFKIYFML